MRMIECSFYPVIPYLHVQQHDREVTSMSDFVHTGRGPKMASESRLIESRLLFVACYLLSLSRAVVMRLMPWRRQNAVGQPRQSIFMEASSAASAMVASSFVGL